MSWWSKLCRCCILEEGACCLYEGNCEELLACFDLTAAQCAEIPLCRIFHPGQTCAETTCEIPIGACCFPDCSCLGIRQNTCESIEGAVWLGPGTDCQGSPCCDLGACCVPVDNPDTCDPEDLFECQPDTTIEECSATGGFWNGEGSTCDPNPCPTPPPGCTLCPDALTITATPIADQPPGCLPGPTGSLSCSATKLNGVPSACSWICQHCDELLWCDHTDPLVPRVVGGADVDCFLLPDFEKESELGCSGQVTAIDNALGRWRMTWRVRWTGNVADTPCACVCACNAIYEKPTRDCIDPCPGGSYALVQTAGDCDAPGSISV